MPPTNEQLERVRDSLDWIGDARDTLADAIGDLMSEAAAAGIEAQVATRLADAAKPGENPARAACLEVLGVDIGDEPPCDDAESDEDEEPVEEESASNDMEDEEPDEDPEEADPALPTAEQLDAIRANMQDVCDAWSELKASCSVLYKVAEKNGVSEQFVDAAIDAVKDDRTGEDADEAFELAREEM